MFSICLLLKLSAEFADPGIKSYHFVANPCYQSGRFLKTQTHTKTGRLLDCIGRCTVTHPCKFVRYNGSSGECWLFDTGVAVHSTTPISILQKISIKQMALDEMKWANSLTVIKDNKAMSQKRAKKLCHEKNARLVKIDSQQKQNVAVALANSTGLKEIIICVQKFLGNWKYCDKDPITYTAWGEQPKSWDLYASMSRKHGFLWVPKMLPSDGAICEKM